MVSQDDMYPNFPVMTCDVCGARDEVPRSWVSTVGMGEQILIDWRAAELQMFEHRKMHEDDLITGVEDYLRADARRRGAQG